jgi:putative transposase
VKGQWLYFYRAVDKESQTVDFMSSEKRYEPAERVFFEKAIGSSGLPDKVTMDKSGVNKAGIDTINVTLALLFMLGGMFVQLTVRQIKYLKDIAEQDHRFIKKITEPMKGFKAFHSAEATFSGMERHHMLRKKQRKQFDRITIFERLTA